MINDILMKINDYNKEQRLLNDKFKAIIESFDNSSEELISKIENLSLEDSEKFLETNRNFMNNELVSKLKLVIDNKKITARYMPILNELSSFGFSKNKIVKLDEFLKRYIEPSYGSNSKTTTISLQASGLYKILTSEDKKILSKFLIDNKIATPILRYYCVGYHDEDEFSFDSKVVEYNESDISNIEKYIELEKLSKESTGSVAGEYLDKLEELESNIKLYCPTCGTDIDLSSIIKSYKLLMDGSALKLKLNN